MKNFTFLIIALLFAGVTQAQVTEGTMSNSLGSGNALNVTIKSMKVGDVEDLWKDYMKQYDGKSKFNRKTDELFIDNASIRSINDNNTVDVTSKVTQQGDDASIAVWFDLGGAYLSSTAHADRYPAAQDIMNGFIKYTEKYKTEQWLKEENKKLSKLEDNKKDLEKDNAGWEKDIKKCEDNIKEWRSKIDKGVIAIDGKVKEIEAQKQVVEKVKEQLSKY